MTKYSFITFFLIVFMVGCKQDKKAPEPTTSPIENSDVFKKIKSPDDLAWLQGSWESEDKSTIESWAIQGDSLAGNMYSAQAKQITEVLSIVRVAGSWMYKTRILDPQNPRVIMLGLENSTTNKLVFSNPAYDYPNKVEYKRLDEKSMMITISGNNSNPSSYKTFKLD